MLSCLSPRWLAALAAVVCAVLPPQCAENARWGPRLAATVSAQQTVPPPLVALPDRPVTLDTSRRGNSGEKIPGPHIRVVPMKGLTRPYALAFLPDGAMLITERPGRIRIVRNGVLDPQPVSGVPEVHDRNYKGLND